MAVLIVSSWHTECTCGYGAGGWSASPALDGNAILTPDSDHCPGCDSDVTEVIDELGAPYYEEDEDGEAPDSRQE